MKVFIRYVSPKSRISFSFFVFVFVFWYICFSLSITTPRYFFLCFTCFVVLSLYEVSWYAYSLVPLFSYFVKVMCCTCVVLI